MEMSRREILASLAGLVAMASTPCAHCQDIFPETYPRKKRTSAASAATSSWIDDVGCADFSAFGEDGGAPSGLSTRSGIPWLDHVLSQELYIMLQVFGLMPAVFFYDESGGSNALATPDLMGGSQFRHGTVLIGRSLTNELLDKYRGRSPISTGDHALGAVVAHEWAHIAQFNSGITFGGGKSPELHADFMSGWYQAGRVISGMGTINLNFSESAEELFQRGDFDFNSPSHHGVPEERVGAYMAGLQTAGRGVLGFRDAFNHGLRFLG